MVRATWEEFTANLSSDELDFLQAFRDVVLELPEVEERIHRTELQFRRKRIFAVAFILAHRLELAIDLPRPVDHPRLLAAFHTADTVYTHRLSLTSIRQLDDSVIQLLTEAYETVGSGR